MNSAQNLLDIRVVLEEGVIIPEYKTAGSSGADVCAYIPEPTRVTPGERVLIPTGIRFEIPFGYEIQVRSRSGLSWKEGLVVLNAPGTIDSDYRGELKIILYNSGSNTVIVNPGDRIAQIVVVPVQIARFIPTSDSLNTTKRSEGGFGHTGV